MRGGRYYVRATKLGGMAEMAAERRISFADLLQEAGIDPAAMRHPEMVLDYGRFCDLLQRCAIAWDLPDIGLRMAASQAIDFLGPVALVTRMERTVRGAMQAIAVNLPLHSNATIMALEEEADTATLTLNRRGGAPDSRENAELVMAQGKLALDGVAGRQVPLIEAGFPHERGASARAVSAFFGCPIHYGRTRQSLSFDRSVLDQRIEKSDMAYHPLIRRYLAQSHAEIATGRIDDARTEVARQMEFGQCTLESVAHALRMAPRSLQRHLKSEGSSFRDLVDEWRRERALAMVANTRLPLSEISQSLGYSEQSVFSQAFRRWYGNAPQKFRTGHPGTGG